MKRVLVITMYCGEPQFHRCTQSIHEQINVICDHRVITNKPNVEAHRELYETINESGLNYDYFVKLDADMEFALPNSLSTILSYFEMDTDHLTIPVLDYFINDDMPMFHVFSNRVKVDTSKMDALYVDKVQIKYPGSKKSISNSQSLVLHCFKPTIEQAYTFGVHRAMKVIQADRVLPSLSSSKYHYETLLSVYSNFQVNNKKTLHSALSGAIDVYMGRLTSTMIQKKDFLQGEVALAELEVMDKIFKRNTIISLMLIIDPLRFILAFAGTKYRKIFRRINSLTRR